MFFCAYGKTIACTLRYISDLLDATTDGLNKAMPKSLLGKRLGPGASMAREVQSWMDEFQVSTVPELAAAMKDQLETEQAERDQYKRARDALLDAIDLRGTGPTEQEQTLIDDLSDRMLNIRLARRKLEEVLDLYVDPYLKGKKLYRLDEPSYKYRRGLDERYVHESEGAATLK